MEYNDIKIAHDIRKTEVQAKYLFFIRLLILFSIGLIIDTPITQITQIIKKLIITASKILKSIISLHFHAYMGSSLKNVFLRGWLKTKRLIEILKIRLRMNLNYR